MVFKFANPIILLFLAFFILIMTSKIKEPFNTNCPLTTSQSSTGNVVPENINIEVNWRKNPAQKLSHMIAEYGLPDLVDVNQGGLALWKQTTLAQRGFCWNEVRLYDNLNYFVNISYFFPLLQLRGKLEFKKALNDINHFDPAVLFDQTNQTINVKANSPQQAIVLLVLSKRLLSKELNLQQSQNILNSILLSIQPKSKSYDPNAYNKFKLELCS